MPKTGGKCAGWRWACYFTGIFSVEGLVYSGHWEGKFSSVSQTSVNQLTVGMLCNLLPSWLPAYKIGIIIVLTNGVVVSIN